MEIKSYNKGLNNAHELKYDDAWERAKARGIKLPWDSDDNPKGKSSKDSPKELESNG